MAARQLGYAGRRELYVALGEGKVPRKRARNAIPRGGAGNGGIGPADWPDDPPAIIEIDAGAPVTMCSHCLPLPDERIAGIASANESITVHALYCDRLVPLEDGDWIDLHWDRGANQHPRYRTRVKVVLANVFRALARVCNRIGQLDANIEDVIMPQKRRDYFDVIFELSVRDLRHLHQILSAIGQERVVYKAFRMGSDLETQPDAAP